MRINNLKKLTISALVLVMNNPSYDDDTRMMAEIEFRNRIKNLGYDLNDFAQEELAVIMGRGYSLDAYLIGPNPDMQLLMQLYFKYHNQPEGERTLLFSETHMCNDVYDMNNFFTEICRLEVANIERRMMHNECNQGIIAAYNALLERVLDAKLKRHRMSNFESQFGQRIYSYGNNMSAEERKRIDSSLVLRAKSALMERLNDAVMQSNFAQYKYGEHFVKKDEALLSKQMKSLYTQVKSGYNVDYNTNEMAEALKLERTKL